MPANFWVVPQEVSGVHVQDTLETSLFAPHLFPTDDGPAHKHPTPLPNALRS